MDLAGYKIPQIERLPTLSSSESEDPYAYDVGDSDEQSGEGEESLEQTV